MLADDVGPKSRTESSLKLASVRVNSVNPVERRLIRGAPPILGADLVCASSVPRNHRIKIFPAELFHSTCHPKMMLGDRWRPGLEPRRRSQSWLCVFPVCLLSEYRSRP